MAEALIRERVEELVRAIRAKDIDGVMSCYGPGIVSFDLNPPLRYGGTEKKRRAWHDVFASFPGAIGYDVSDLHVTTLGDLGFVHSVNHVNGTLAGGRVSDLWVRWTACFQRIDGAWLIVHDQVSVPLDVATGRGAVDLEP